jgi:hypothetical protein
MRVATQRVCQSEYLFVLHSLQQRRHQHDRNEAVALVQVLIAQVVGHDVARASESGIGVGVGGCHSPILSTATPDSSWFANASITLAGSDVVQSMAALVVQALRRELIGEHDIHTRRTSFGSC